jgi:hypothetical protein
MFLKKFLATYVTLNMAHRMEGKRKKNKDGGKKTISMKFNMKHIMKKIFPSPLKRASTPKNRVARSQGEVRSLKMAKNTMVKNILVNGNAKLGCVPLATMCCLDPNYCVMSSWRESTIS